MGRSAAVSRSAVGFVVALMIALTFVGSSGAGRADPASDAVARMTELSREAERTAEAIYSAELDLENKLAAQRAAEDRRRIEADVSAVAQADLIRFQGAVNELAAAAYTGGPADGISAALTAQSPQRLLDELSLRQVMTTQISKRMTAFRAASSRADTAARAADAAELGARTAAQQAAAVRAELQAKQSRLRAQITEVEALYRSLTPDQRAVLADPGPVPSPQPVPPEAPAIVAMPEFSPPAPGLLPDTGGGTAVVQAALTRVGAPYSWGATGPDAFDCSGLIKWAFLQNGKSLPRSSQALAAGGQPVAVPDLRPGDIVTFYSDASHAGIYIGDGNMVHASTYGTPVKVAPISSAPIYNARRY
ncbi:peptidoglycan hydrolase RipC [Mycolicibacterium arseniciresistens]|uniref:Peptidoglycan hydrolase RipC n=1 Tax=Mycolicibacterium arseniciresistens TaxID=3062257 RepID=A0ABT8UA84_9MYCO|nr:peptidoglycan hydrolase RipC [Mycolicibacterium arseniciresistens]MDO3634703.1 peptidoglycan hydrolase RipC [Mycolicibacterium arseniciresistens]